MTQTEATAETTAQIRKTFPFDCTTVFDAWLEADAVRQFMCPHPGHVSHAEVDGRVGGAFRIDMTIGEHTLVHTGEYLEISRPDRLVFTWASPATHGQPTQVELDFLDQDGQTELVLKHTGLPSAEMAQNHTEGWRSILDRMAEAIG